MKKTPRVPVDCTVCGASFGVVPSRAAKAKYCSNPCRYSGMKKPKVALKCEECGGAFEVFQSHYKRGNARFCSTGCGVSFRNKRDNPAKRSDVRRKISANHADVSGERNPMYWKRGKLAPGYVDGRNAFRTDVWRGIALANKPHRCEVCGCQPEDMRLLHVHHKDKDRSNNDLSNLQLACARCHNTILHERERDANGRYLSGERAA